MKVFLIKDVAKLGHRGNVVEVSDGYARNFLIPSGLAALASDPQARKISASLHAQQKARAALHQKSAALIKKLEPHTFAFQRRANEQGMLYAAIGSADIAAAISQFLALSVTPRDIGIPQPIKKLGRHTATVHFVNQKVTINLSVISKTQ